MKKTTAKKKAKLKALKAQQKAFIKSLRICEKEIEQLSTRKMKPGGGRLKGNGYENATAKRVVEAFEEFGITREDCYRTPSSGGHRYAKKEDPSDLVISKKLRTLFPFSVECKSYKRVDLHPFLLPEKKWQKSWSPKAWLAQACKACTVKGMFPMLVFKQNKGPDLCAIPALYPCVTELPIHLRFRYKDEDWFIITLSRLLRSIAKHHREEK